MPGNARSVWAVAAAVCGAGLLFGLGLGLLTAARRPAPSPPPRPVAAAAPFAAAVPPEAGADDAETAFEEHYLLPQSLTRLLTDHDLEGLDARRLALARNEIFARHGYVFQRQEFRDYFSQQSWYRPDAHYQGTNLSEVEQANVGFLQRHERQAAPRPAAPPATSADRPAAPARPTSSPTRTICLDPGHTATTIGCVAADGTKELTVAWQVALKLRELLVERGCEVTLTKASEGQEVGNEARAALANELHAELFLRLHCDAGPPGARGFAVYYPDRPATKGGVTGPPQDICARSGAAAACLVSAMGVELGGELRSNGVKTDRQTAVGAKQGALTGSIHSLVPVVTVEMVHLSSAADTAWIEVEANQWRMAKALAEGVEGYFAGGGGSTARSPAE